MRLRASRSRDPAADRLWTAVFVAALAHGLLILGLQFGAPDAPPEPLPTLEILLVPGDAAESETPNEDAPYLAQRDQQGSGTGDEARRSSLPDARPAPEPDAAPADAEEEPPLPEEFEGRDSVLARRALDAARLPTGAESVPPRPMYYAQPSPPLPAVGMDATVADRELYLRGNRSLDGKLLADTRESAIASYLDGWKRRIERVGTLNFPNEARRRHLSGNPVLEVAIRANGTLESVHVRRSSGHRELDEAAVGIVRLAAPFDPFSPALRKRYPVLRFAYEWQFLNGRLGGDGAVFTGAP